MDKNKIFIFGIIIVLIIMLGGVTFALWFTANSLRNTATSAPAQNVSREGLDLKKIKLFPIAEPIMTNLLSEDKKEDGGVVRLTVSIAVNSKEKDYKNLEIELNDKMTMTRHTIIEILRNKTYSELKESNAQAVLGEEIRAKLQEMFMTNSIIDIYFGEFFIQ